jgi:GGDEF domain-containing protein
LKYGHDFGDLILAQWGKIIQAAFRKDEITSYWGNGDFILAIPNLDCHQGREYLTEVLTILRKQIFTAPSGDRIQVTCNCLLAEFPHRGTSLDSLYQACFC